MKSGDKYCVRHDSWVGARVGLLCCAWFYGLSSTAVSEVTARPFTQTFIFTAPPPLCLGRNPRLPHLLVDGTFLRLLVNKFVTKMLCL